MPLTTEPCFATIKGAQLRGNILESLQEILVQAGSEILLGNGKLSLGKFWFCHHDGGGRAGGSIVLFIALFTLVASG